MHFDVFGCLWRCSETLTVAERGCIVGWKLFALKLASFEFLLQCLELQILLVSYLYWENHVSLRFSSWQAGTCLLGTR